MLESSLNFLSSVSLQQGVWGMGHPVGGHVARVFQPDSRAGMVSDGVGGVVFQPLIKEHVENTVSDP